MNRRLYYVLPSVHDTQEVVNALLIKRISVKHMHVIGPEGVNLKDLPKASLFQTSDFRHSLVVGLFVGFLLGVGAGIAFHIALDIPFGGYMVLCVLVGIFLGGWSSTMIGMSTSNVELGPFKDLIDEGKLLLMVDIPQMHVEDIEILVEKIYPGAKFKGVEPTYPSFP